MIPPIFPICAASPGVVAVFGSSPTRVYPFGLVEQTPELPYAVWQNIGGGAEMYLGDLPDVDSYSTQLDVYAADPTSLLTAAKALRDAVEPHAYVTRWGSQELDEETKMYRYSFDVDWIVPR